MNSQHLRLKWYFEKLDKYGSDIYFDALHVQVFMQQNILEALKFEWKSAKMLAVASTFFQIRWQGKELNAHTKQNGSMFSSASESDSNDIVIFVSLSL